MPDEIVTPAPPAPAPAPAPAKPPWTLNASTAGLLMALLSLLSGLATNAYNARYSAPASASVAPVPVPALPGLSRNPSLTVRLITDPADPEVKDLVAFATHEGLPTLVVSAPGGSVLFAKQVKFPPLGAR